MNIISFILAIIAVVCFLLVTWGLRRGNAPAWDLTALGLALVTTAWIIQGLWISHAQQIHF